MQLVIDANLVFSMIFSKARGAETKKLEILFSNKFELFAPEILIGELERNKEKIKLNSDFSDIDFDDFIKILKSRITLLPSKYFSDKKSEAEKICKDLKDLTYFALALKLNCPIWSGEKSFKQQSKIKVFNTKELVEESNLLNNKS